MNDSSLVTDETRARIREVASRMWYAPHGAARSLITRRTHTIGVLLPDLYGEFFSEVIRGIDLTAKRSGYHCLISSARHDGPQLEAALRSMRGRVDGLVLMSPEFTGELSHRTLPGGFPVVLLNCPPSELDCDSLTVANYEGAYAMVRHFVGMGHRRIALINGAAGNFDAAERRRGYHVALRDAGLPVLPELEIPGDFTEESGHAAALALLALADRPTAIFAANDCMAIGALSGLRDHRVLVPEDIAIGGFDDIPMARYVVPALTSVHVDISALGERAAARLLAKLRRPPNVEISRETHPTTLVVRRSCGSQNGLGSFSARTPPRRSVV
jgi:LacI family transcriptional regulator